MFKLTGKEIEKRAVMELITYVESWTDRIILQSMEEMERLNEQKKVQGIYPKKRIDDECVRRAIKTINNSAYPLMSIGTGGNTQKKEIDFEKHLKEEAILTEVT
jgi:hypothetical protein